MEAVPDLRRSERIALRLRRHERAALDRAAVQSRQNFSEWCRAALIEAAQRRLARAPAP